MTVQKTTTRSVTVAGRVSLTRSGRFCPVAMVPDGCFHFLTVLDGLAQLAAPSAQIPLTSGFDLGSGKFDGHSFWKFCFEGLEKGQPIREGAELFELAAVAFYQTHELPE